MKMKADSLSFRLFVTNVLLIVIPLTMIGVYGYVTYIRHMEEVTHQYSLQILGKLRQQVDDTFQQIDDAMVSLWISADFQKLIREPSEEWRDHPQEYFHVLNNISNLFGWRKGNRGLFVITSEGGVLHELTRSAIKPNYPFTEQPFFIRTKSHRQLSITGPHIQDYMDRETVFSLTRPLLQTPNLEWRGAIHFDLDAQEIYRLFESVEFGTSGYFMAIQPDGTVVYHPDAAWIAAKSDFPYADKVMASSNGSFTSPVDGKPHFITFETSKLTGWKLIGIVPVHELNAGAKQIKNALIAVGLVTAFVGFLATVQINRVLLRPLHQLNRAISRIGRGIFDQHIPLPPIRELHSVVNQYNRSIDKLQQLTEDLYITRLKQQEAELSEQQSRLKQQEMELRQREAELSQLQAQINPHFLYNTLSCIDSMAEKYRNPHIQDAIRSLSRVLRYSVSSGRPQVTVKEEWRHAEAFIAIQNYRHGDRIQVDLDAESTVWEAVMLRLTLQPLLENAYFHGLEPKYGLGRVTVRLTVENENTLVVSVEDDGLGMSSEILRELETFVESRGTVWDGINMPARYSGLRNVLRRYFLAYGEACRIRIDSAPDRGTSVTIRLPYQRTT